MSSGCEIAIASPMRPASRRLMRIAWDSVGDIVTRVVADHLSDARFDNLVLIGGDEISYRRGQRYLGRW